MDANNEQPEQGWDSGWDEHKKRQRQRMAALPFEQKLEWLEETQQLVERLVSQVRARLETEERQ